MGSDFLRYFQRMAALAIHNTLLKLRCRCRPFEIFWISSAKEVCAEVANIIPMLFKCFRSCVNSYYNMFFCPPKEFENI